MIHYLKRRKSQGDDILPKRRKSQGDDTLPKEENLKEMIYYLKKKISRR